MDPILPAAAAIARDRMEDHVHSARPDAPVRPDPAPRSPRFARSRTAVSRLLLRASRAVAPAPRCRSAH